MGIGRVPEERRLFPTLPLEQKKKHIDEQITNDRVSGVKRATCVIGNRTRRSPAFACKGMLLGARRTRRSSHKMYSDANIDRENEGDRSLRTKRSSDLFKISAVHRSADIRFSCSSRPLRQQNIRLTVNQFGFLTSTAHRYLKVTITSRWHRPKCKTGEANCWLACLRTVLLACKCYA
jgi:hypothetical protein